MKTLDMTEFAGGGAVLLPVIDGGLRLLKF